MLLLGKLGLANRYENPVISGETLQKHLDAHKGILEDALKLANHHFLDPYDRTTHLRKATQLEADVKASVVCMSMAERAGLLVPGDRIFQLFSASSSKSDNPVLPLVASLMGYEILAVSLPETRAEDQKKPPLESIERAKLLSRDFVVPEIAREVAQEIRKFQPTIMFQDVVTGNRLLSLHFNGLPKEDVFQAHLEIYKAAAGGQELGQLRMVRLGLFEAAHYFINKQETDLPQERNIAKPQKPSEILQTISR